VFTSHPDVLQLFVRRKWARLRANTDQTSSS
jgi:hypothetical protein